MNTVEQRVLHALGDTPGASLWESLIGLFRADREAFYLLACDGVSAEASARLVELAEQARRVRAAVRGSYQIESSGGRSYIVSPGMEPIFVPSNLVEKVDAFLRAADGKGIQDGPGKDYEGSPVSEAETRFQLGGRASWEADQKSMQARLDARPLVLRLDAEDISHLATQPGYVTFSLKECARRTVLAPTQVFRE